MKIIKELGVVYPINGGKQKLNSAIYECEKCLKHFQVVKRDAIRRNQKMCQECAKKYAMEKAHEKNTKHGDSKTRLNSIYNNMMARCYNKKHKSYKDYGKRKIEVCFHWHKYENFKKWALKNGYKENLTIERRNNSAGYCWQNCEWTTQKAQCNNRRNSIPNIYTEQEFIQMKKDFKKSGLIKNEFYKQTKVSRSTFYKIIKGDYDGVFKQQN